MHAWRMSNNYALLYSSATLRATVTDSVSFSRFQLGSASVSTRLRSVNSRAQLVISSARLGFRPRGRGRCQLGPTRSDSAKLGQPTQAEAPCWAGRLGVPGEAVT
jgi:hypothetical protein